MALNCPYCRHGVSLRDPKPGRFQPKCPKCGRRFQLIVPPVESGEPPRIEKLPQPDETGESARTTAGLEATMAPTGTPASAPQGAEGGRAVADATLPAGVEATAFGAVEATAPPAVRPAPAADPTLVHAASSQTTGFEQTAFQPAAAAPASGVRTQASPSATAGGFDATLAPPPSPASDRTAAVRAAAATRAAEGDGRRTQHDARAPGGPAAPVPQALGGYRLLRELGRGAMGAVYLARQLSLNRNVALKLIQAQWAGNPAFVARFMREAYAAAQLTHHNVVQIYDLGSDQGTNTNFFSMEFVNGKSLADVIAEQGPLEPRVAVGYILQAARGLQFAHQQGMVHRDVKPANLMLNDQGVVKVADLGLVKAPQLADDLDSEPAAAGPTGASTGSLAAAVADVTLLNTAMGTPAYMAPEQADNAAGVDHRADIYSLGCTLYVLLVGRTPFEGGTAMEVITKHKSKPIVWPESMAAKIPGGLSSIVMRMVAKKPEERYPDLGSVIRDLEGFLASDGPESVEQKRRLSQTVEQAAREFDAAAGAKLRTPAGLAILAGSVGAAVLALPFSLKASVGLLACGAVALAVRFILGGLSEGGYLFDKTRAALATLRWSDWGAAIGGGALALVVALLVGWLPPLLAGALLGAGLGAGCAYGLDRTVARRRRPAVERAETALKELRLRGVDEAGVRQFVLEAGGTSSDEFFEALFGFEAKQAERARLQGSETLRRWKKSGAWREPLLKRLDARIARAREDRDRAQLQRIEEQNLAARGVSPEEARAQAEAMAHAMVQEMLAQRAQSDRPAAGATVVDPRVAARQKRERIKRMLDEARQSAPRRRWSALFTGPLGFALSGKIRFLAGCLLLVGFALWIKQSGLLSTESLQELPSRLPTELPTSAGAVVEALPKSSTESPPLPVAGALFSGWSAGLAGLLLVGTGLFRGARMSIFAWPAAIVVLLGPTFGLNPWIGAAAGVGLALLGLLLGRSRE